MCMLVALARTMQPRDTTRQWAAQEENTWPGHKAIFDDLFESH